MIWKLGGWCHLWSESPNTSHACNLCQPCQYLSYSYTIAAWFYPDCLLSKIRQLCILISIYCWLYMHWQIINSNYIKGPWWVWPIESSRCGSAAVSIYKGQKEMGGVGFYVLSPIVLISFGKKFMALSSAPERVSVTKQCLSQTKHTMLHVHVVIHAHNKFSVALKCKVWQGCRSGTRNKNSTELKISHVVQSFVENCGFICHSTK